MRDERDELSADRKGTTGGFSSNLLRRASLMHRKPYKRPDNTDTKSAGGVTATPHTGSLPRISAPIRTSTTTSDSSTGQAHLAVPGIPAQGGLNAQSNRAKKIGPKQRSNQLRSPGWIPDQHGAWAMLVIPYLIGSLMSSFSWRHLVIFTLWVMSYLSYFAVNLWLRSQRKEQYWPPVRTYGLVTVLLGAISVLIAPELLEWSFAFIPLIVITIYESARRKERDMLARTCTVIASGLMLPVGYDLGTGFQRSAELIGWLHRVNSATAPIAPPVSPTSAVYGWPWVIIVTLAVTAYFWSTIPYVKTLFRQRNSSNYRVFSIAAHCLLTLASFTAFVLGYMTIWNTLIWIALALRSWLVPAWNDSQAQPLKPQLVGRIEIVVSAVYIASIFI